jgi:hypothetical protein
MRRAPVDPRKLLPALGLAIGLAGLLLQLYISMQAYIAAGRDIPGALGAFCAYYTVLTNCVLVLIYLSEVLPAAGLQIFRHPVVRASMAACIALVSIYVVFVLRFLYTLTGLSRLADTLLHYVAPLLYLIWWAIAQPHGLLRWSNIPVMLAPTLVYFVLIMLRGVWVQEYPYPFMDAAELGYSGVLVGALMLATGLAVLAATIIGLDRILSRNWNLVHE